MVDNFIIILLINSLFIWRLHVIESYETIIIMLNFYSDEPTILILILYYTKLISFIYIFINSKNTYLILVNIKL